jgi:hypothetical protein
MKPNCMDNTRPTHHRVVRSQRDGTGRPIGPSDLWALRGFFAECASLSAEAALIHVLVERIRDAERISVHAGDLLSDLRQCISWRDAPKPPDSARLRLLLKRLGFRPTARDRDGVLYEVRWEQLWDLDPRGPFRHDDESLLSGAELLHLLVAEPSLFFSPRLWCPRCKRVVGIILGLKSGGQEGGMVCASCGGATRVVEQHSRLKRASRRIRGALVADHTLLPAVKAEWEALRDGTPFPNLPKPFDWLNRAWERAGRPRGRPSNLVQRYELAHAVGRLRVASVSKAMIERIFAGSPSEREGLCRRLPAEVHRFLGVSAARFLGNFPSIDARTLWASVEWAQRMWSNPSERLHRTSLFKPDGKTLGSEETTVPQAPADTCTIESECPKCRGRALQSSPQGEDFMVIACLNCGWDRLVRVRDGEEDGEPYDRVG